MIFSTSGYYSTGSSAVYVLLKEYENCEEGILRNWELRAHDYENVFLYMPNGLFDLEDKLLYGNSIHRSDEAIRGFLSEMRRLNDNKYGWCGDYQRLIGDEFMNMIREFVDSLIDYKVQSHWGYHLGNDKLSCRKFLGSVKRKITGERATGDFWKATSYRTDEMIYYAFPTPEKFYASARKMIDRYCNLMMGSDAEGKDLLLNHFILPHNLYRLKKYFAEEEIRVIVVDRDPRDVFIMEKYRMRSDRSRIPCQDVREFVSFWKKLRCCEKQENDPRVVRIRFEDMIYKYEDTVSFLESRCGLDPRRHIHKKEYFSVEKSMYNTQLFKQDTIWAEEIRYIEKELPEYIYPFPEGSGIKEKLSAGQYGIYVS